MKTFLKLLSLAAIMLFVLNTTLYSQLVYSYKPIPAKDTLTNTDTTTIDVPVNNDAQSVQLKAVRNSGNTGTSSIILQGSIDGVNWYAIDTFSLTNAALNTKVVNLRSSTGTFIYAKYRALCLSAGSVSWSPTIQLLRRSK